MAKTAKSDGNGTRLVATDSRPRPADFPLGSVESRAAARAMLQTSERLSQYDEDCLQIYCAVPFIHGGVDPDYQVIEATEVYRQGEAVHEHLYGPDVPVDLYRENDRYDKCGIAALLFCAIHPEEPKPGDLLRYEEVVQSLCEENSKVIPALERAWARRLPSLPCPLKFENGRVYYRSVKSQPQGAWVENHVGDPRFWWSSIEDEALGKTSSGGTEFAPDWQPAIAAVVFVEFEEGVRRVEPLEARSEIA